MTTWSDSIYERCKQYFEPVVEKMMGRGKTVSAQEYINAMESRPILNSILNEYFEQYDAIVAPVAPGEAPNGLHTTRNPMFSTPRTFCGVPAVALPLLQGDNSMPVGAQVLEQCMDDARLLRTARWVMQQLSGNAETQTNSTTVRFRNKALLVSI